MTVYVESYPNPETAVIVDTSDNTRFVLKHDQWRDVARLPNEEQRAALDKFTALNKADPTGGRTPTDEQTMETAQNASSGEAHQAAEGGRDRTSTGDTP